MATRSQLLHPLVPALSIFLASITGLAVTAGCGSGEDAATNGDDDVEIAITAPEQDSYHSRARVTVEGTAEGTSEVEVNGKSVPVQGGEWDTTIEFDDGEVTATASAEQTETSVDFIVDTEHPQIIIDSPDRGTMLDDESGDATGTVTVNGEIGSVGPSGLLLFQIDGKTIEIEEGERFEEEVDLREGLNVISVTAVDRAHNETKQHRGVIFGPLTDPDDPIDEALRVDLHHPSGTDALSAVIESYVTPQQLEGFLGDDLELDDGISIEVHEMTWDDLDVEITPRDDPNDDVTPEDGYLSVVLTITDLFVAGAFSFSSGDPINGDISIGEVVVELDVEMSADDDNQLHVEVVDDDLSLDDITVNIDGEESDEAAILVAGAIGFAFNEFLEELVEDNLYDPDILTQEFEFLGSTIVITLLLEEIAIGTGGIVARLGIEFPGDKAPVVPDVPGALHREIQGSPGGGISRPVIFHSHRTALERIVHALWQSGLFHQNLGEEEGIDMPFNLDAAGLATLLDSRIRDIHDSDTPVEMRLRPLLPAVVEFGDERDGEIELGDFLIDFYLRPDENTETLVLTLALQLFVDLEFEIGVDEVDLDVDVDTLADIHAQPEITFDPDDTIGLITQLVDILPDLALDDLSIEPETTFEWASIDNPDVEFNQDIISVGIDIEPADDFIEDDDVDPDD